MKTLLSAALALCTLSSLPASAADTSVATQDGVVYMHAYDKCEIAVRLREWRPGDGQRIFAINCADEPAAVAKQ